MIELDVPQAASASVIQEVFDKYAFVSTSRGSCSGLSTPKVASASNGLVELLHGNPSDRRLCAVDLQQIEVQYKLTEAGLMFRSRRYISISTVSTFVFYCDMQYAFHSHRPVRCINSSTKIGTSPVQYAQITSNDELKRIPETVISTSN